MADTCSPGDVTGNTGLAFGLVAASGMSTMLGAALSFCAPTKGQAARLFLAGSLAIAAGVMVYVSFAEIFTTKSVDAFASCVAGNYAYLYASLCFFGGIILTWLLDIFVHKLEHWLPTLCATVKEVKDVVKERSGRFASGVVRIASRKQLTAPPTASNSIASDINLQAEAQAEAESQSQSQTPLEYAEIDLGADSRGHDHLPAPSPTMRSADLSTEDIEVAGAGHEDIVQSDHEDEQDVPVLDEEVAHDGLFIVELYNSSGTDAKSLARMGAFAGLALGMHNFPEGLATFVSVLSNPKVGASVAIAIALHNIPEGICVAMPIFYATGSRFKAFMWASISGLTELLGAFLGWVILKDVLSQIVYGVLFGIIAGMMVYISMKELLPTAHKYDPEDKIVTWLFIAGMAIMSLSLVLFKF